MDLKKHVPIISLIMGFVITMCSTTAYIIGSIHGVEDRLSERISRVEKDIAIIKTVLIMKDMMPRELASNSSNIQAPQSP